MTGSRKDLGIGMVGYAFMGAAHSQAWRTAPAFFDLPLHPRMAAICGRNARRPAMSPGVSAGSRRDRLASAAHPRRHRRHRHLHSRRHPRRDRDRRARGRQARAVREATRQQRRRGRGDGRRRGRGRSARRTGDGRVHLPPHSGRGARPALVAEVGSGRSATYERSTCRTGSPTRTLPSTGASTRTRPARDRSVTSAPTSSTWRSTSPARRSSRSTG